MSVIDPLNAIEARILGCLLEKEITLPDYYPLTLNALTAACNQTTNREPIMNLDDNQVRRALDSLKARGWVFEISIVGARVNKYRHNLKARLPGLEHPSVCLLCVLLLRGEQTLGELRQRTERLQSFPDLPAVEAELMKLITYSEGPLVACLPAGPGRRVAQYAQLLTGEPATGLAPKEIIQFSTPAADPAAYGSLPEFPQAAYSAPVYPPSAPTAPLPPPAAPTAIDDQAWRQRMEMEIEILKAQLNRLKVRLGVED
ncbi:MAG: hypothetical protein CJBNEKGG_01997 [Prosthecobacter sp.]|nr:hypothetical protein [Prosthecobacter sp.]